MNQHLCALESYFFLFLFSLRLFSASLPAKNYGGCVGTSKFRGPLVILVLCEYGFSGVISMRLFLGFLRRWCSSEGGHFPSGHGQMAKFTLHKPSPWCRIFAKNHWWNQHFCIGLLAFGSLQDTAETFQDVSPRHSCQFRAPFIGIIFYIPAEDRLFSQKALTVAWLKVMWKQLLMNELADNVSVCWLC